MKDVKKANINPRSYQSDSDVEVLDLTKKQADKKQKAKTSHKAESSSGKIIDFINTEI